jgi:imidazolonepropionase
MKNIVIYNAKIVTPLGSSARRGKEMQQLQIIENGEVEVRDGIICYVGKTRNNYRDGFYDGVSIF